MPNRQFYTYKFKSSRLKEFGYNIDILFDEAKELKEVPPTVAEAYVSWDIEELTKRQIVKKYKNYYKKENE